MANNRDVLDSAGAAEYLGMHEQTIRRLARQKKIPAYKVGSVWRFNKSLLYRWAESQQADTGSKTVLVVDDEEVIRDTVRRLLEQKGLSAITAADGTDALEIIRRESPDAVILDLKLPDINGVAVLKEIRMRHGDLPVIVITGYPDSHLVGDALEHSPIMLLAKPVAPGKLLQAISMALAGSTTRTQ